MPRKANLREEEKEIINKDKEEIQLVQRAIAEFEEAKKEAHFDDEHAKEKMLIRFSDAAQSQRFRVRIIRIIEILNKVGIIAKQIEIKSELLEAKIHSIFNKPNGFLTGEEMLAIRDLKFLEDDIAESLRASHYIIGHVDYKNLIAPSIDMIGPKAKEIKQDIILIGLGLDHLLDNFKKLYSIETRVEQEIAKLMV